MNYKNVAKKKKKNKAIIVIASILACVLAGGAIAGLGFHFDWWNAEKEVEGSKSVPTSTFDIEIGSIEDLEGVAFEYEDYTFKMSTYKMTKEELVAYGVLNSVEDEVNFNGEALSSIINVDPFGVAFELPEAGEYKVTVKINGEEYSSEAFSVNEYNVESEDLQIVLMGYIAFDKDGNQIDLVMEEVETQLSEADHVIMVALFDAIMIDADHDLKGVDGYTLMINSMFQHTEGYALDTFEIVNFEKIEVAE